MSIRSDPIENVVQNYLSSRTFVNTSRAFEQDCNAAKDGNYQSERFMEELTQAIDKLDVEKVCGLWDSWNAKIVNALDQDHARLAQNYEASTYRVLLVKCVQKKEIIKCNEFFQKRSALTQNNPQWTDWFSFPYNVHAEKSEPYRRYFDKAWQEIFLLSLQNFLSLTIPLATSSMLSKIMENISKEPSDGIPTILEFDEDLIDDFAVIAPSSCPVKRSHGKPSLRNILKSLTGGSKRSTD